MLIVAHDQSYLRLYKVHNGGLVTPYMGVSQRTQSALSPETPSGLFLDRYGLNECLPVIPGRLGVLSGNHLIGKAI